MCQSYAMGQAMAIGSRGPNLGGGKQYKRLLAVKNGDSPRPPILYVDMLPFLLLAGGEVK